MYHPDQTFAQIFHIMSGYFDFMIIQEQRMLY